MAELLLEKYRLLPLNTELQRTFILLSERATLSVYQFRQKRVLTEVNTVREVQEVFHMLCIGH
jgi:hypothetical protein